MKTQAAVNAAHPPTSWVPALRGYPPSLRGVPGRRSGTLALGTLLFWLGLGAARPAWALTTISSDTTISTTISDDVQVTGSANVNIVPGGMITGRLNAYNGSAVTLTGGTVNGSVTAYDSSTLTVLDGSTIDVDIEANESCTVEISGGSIGQSGGLGMLVNSGTVNVSGGSISGIYGVRVDGGTLSISGGTISSSSSFSPSVSVYGGALSISGGWILRGSAGGVNVHGGTVSILGGTISGDSSSSAGVSVGGGTVSISGGAISGGTAGLDISNGAASISGGSFSGTYDVLVDGGMVSISGGSFPGSSVSGSAGVFREGGTASIFGCGLHLFGGTLNGALQDGTPITMPTLGLSDGDLHNQQPQLTPPANLTVPADPNLCTATLNPGTATVAGSDCGSIPAVMGARSDSTVLIPKALNDPYPLGTTTITWTATDRFGGLSHAQQTVTVLDTQKPSLTLPASQTVNATSDAGAAVNFTVAATDNCPLVSVDYSPASGTTFPIGTTVVTGTATDSSGNQTSGSFSITVLPLADLRISLAASPVPVRNKQNLTYTLTVSSTGPTTATGVVISDPLPAGTTFLSATASAGVMLSAPLVGANGTLVGKLASLGPTGSATVALTVAVNSKNTSISNTASVSAGTPDPVTSNNTATLAVAVK